MTARRYRPKFHYHAQSTLDSPAPKAKEHDVALTMDLGKESEIMDPHFRNERDRNG